MGIEYRITAANGKWPMSEQETVNWILRLTKAGRLPGNLSSGRPFEFRMGNDNSDWPDIVLDVEQDGLYLCKYCRKEVDMFLGCLVSELAAIFSEPGFTFVEL